MKAVGMVLVAVMMVFLFFGGSVNADCVVPHDNLYINENTTLCSGWYNLNDSELNGIIIINASNVVLDCNGTTINGSGASIYGSMGIYLYSGEINYLYAINRVIIKNCTVRNYDDGISLIFSDYNNLTYNNFSNNSEGIDIFESNQNVITNNIINSNSEYGIYMFGSFDNTIDNNVAILNFDSGILLHTSANNSIANNNLANNSLDSLSIDIQYKPYCDNNISTSNTGGYYGKPILYRHNETGITIENTSEYSAIIFCNVRNSIIKNVNIENNVLKSDGITLRMSNYNNLTNINSSNNLNGIEVYESVNNIISNSTFNSNNRYGIYIPGGAHRSVLSYNNTISANRFCSNNQEDDDYSDIYNYGTNFGYDNICDNVDGWNDEGTLGCTYTCDGKNRFGFTLSFGWNFISIPISAI